MNIDEPTNMHVPAPMSAGRQLAQRIPLLAVKAGFSSLPLAVFAFDLFREVVDFGNAHLVDRLLVQLGDRIGCLENEVRGRIKTDAVYQAVGRAALQKMLSETNPRMADALARAVADLGASGWPEVERMEVARALEVLTEPTLHLLQTLYRAQNNMLTAPELEVVEGDVTQPHHFALLAYASMSMTSWIAPANDLQRSGMVETIVDGGWFAEAHEVAKADEGHTVPLYKVYKTGQRIVKMCFDDPAVPAFGAFAPQVNFEKKAPAE